MKTQKDKGRAAFKAMLANFEEEDGKPKILQPKFFKPEPLLSGLTQAQMRQTQKADEGGDRAG